MSLWAEDPELFLHKGKDGVVHVLRCKKETMTLSSSPSMLLKSEDFTVEGTITDHRSLTGGCYDWDKDKYEALIDYIYPRHLMVNCHGSVIGELATDEKSVLAVLFSTLIFLFGTLIFLFVQLLFNLFHRNSAVLFTVIFLFVQLLFNRFHRNKKATVVLYIRALDILAMGSYGPSPDHPDREVPARMAKYLQDGTIVQTEPTPKELKLSKEVEALKQELLLLKEKTEVELAKEMKLSKEAETLQQELLSDKEKIEVELAKEMKLSEELVVKIKEVESSEQELLLAKEKAEEELAREMKLAEELAIKNKEVETSQQDQLLAKEKIEAELAKEKKFSEELIIKSKEVETLQQLLAKEKTEMEVLIKRVAELEVQMKLMAHLPMFGINEKAYYKYCSLSIRNGHVILESNNQSNPHQYWLKDDKAGENRFVLVNKFTAQALKPVNASSALELVPYDRNVFDESILWVEEEQSGGYKSIRKATGPTSLYLTASTSNGSVTGDGNNVGLWPWCGGDNQKWYLGKYDERYY